LAVVVLGEPDSCVFDRIFDHIDRPRGYVVHADSEHGVIEVVDGRGGFAHDIINSGRVSDFAGPEHCVTVENMWLCGNPLHSLSPSA
jgi:hypothetical protein